MSPSIRSNIDFFELDEGVVICERCERGVLPAGAPEIPATEGYPLVLTRGDGSKLYVSCLAFYDPVPPALATAEPALQVGSLRHGGAPSSRL